MDRKPKDVLERCSPGDWRGEPYYPAHGVLDGSGRRIATVLGSLAVPLDESMANLAIIANAPRVLAALRRTLATLRRVTIEGAAPVALTDREAAALVEDQGIAACD